MKTKQWWQWWTAKLTWVFRLGLGLGLAAETVNAQTDVMMRTGVNGVLRAPTNFFVANSNLLNQAVGGGGGGGLGTATNLAAGLAATNLTVYLNTILPTYGQTNHLLTFDPGTGQILTSSAGVEVSGSGTGWFVGDGRGLTNLTANQISGVIPNGNLPVYVGGQSGKGTNNTFTSPVTTNLVNQGGGMTNMGKFNSDGGNFRSDGTGNVTNATENLSGGPVGPYKIFVNQDSDPIFQISQPDDALNTDTFIAWGNPDDGGNYPLFWQNQELTVVQHTNGQNFGLRLIGANPGTAENTTEILHVDIPAGSPGQDFAYFQSVPLGEGFVVRGDGSPHHTRSEIIGSTNYSASATLSYREWNATADATASNIVLTLPPLTNFNVAAPYATVFDFWTIPAQVFTAGPANYTRIWHLAKIDRGTHIVSITCGTNTIGAQGTNYQLTNQQWVELEQVYSNGVSKIVVRAGGNVTEASSLTGALPTLDAQSLTNLTHVAAILPTLASPTFYLTSGAGGAIDASSDAGAFTNLNAGALATGTVPGFRLGGGTPAHSNFLAGDSLWSYDAGGLTNLRGTNIQGVIPIANLATGTPTGSKFVRDDGTLAVPAGGSAPTFSGQFDGNGATNLAVGYHATNAQLTATTTNIIFDSANNGGAINVFQVKDAAGTVKLSIATNGDTTLAGQLSVATNLITGNATITNAIFTGPNPASTNIALNLGKLASSSTWSTNTYINGNVGGYIWVTNTGGAGTSGEILTNYFPVPFTNVPAVVIAPYGLNTVGRNSAIGVGTVATNFFTIDVAFNPVSATAYGFSWVVIGH